MMAAAMAWGSPAMAIPTTTVPSPLPVFGALSALVFSWALHQQIQKHQANTNQIN
jgi:TRAP-type C4-dicarboxylate transport system permease small subunit